MEYTGCLESVEELVKEATQEFSGRFALVSEKHEELRDICSGVDEFVYDMLDDCICVDTSVDENTKQFTIDVLLDDGIILSNKDNSSFSGLIQKLSSFSFSKTKDGYLRVSFNLDGMWDRVRE